MGKGRGCRLSPGLSPALLSPAHAQIPREEGRGQTEAGFAKRLAQTHAGPAQARPKAQDPELSCAASERELTAKLELCFLMHRSPGALFPASQRTSPKLRNPKSKLGGTSPARQRGRKWVESAAARCLCYKPGTPTS